MKTLLALVISLFVVASVSSCGTDWNINATTPYGTVIKNPDGSLTIITIPEEVEVEATK